MGIAGALFAVEANAQSGSPYVMLHQERASPWLLQLQPGYHHQRHVRRTPAGRVVVAPAHRQRVHTTHTQRQAQPHVHRARPHQPAPQQASVRLTQQLNPVFLPQVVSYNTHHAVGTIIVDPHNHFLYLVEANGQARRYGVGVGRAGFGWSGTATIRRKAEWPTWTPPAAMIQRQPELEEWRHGMPGGLDNPLGARALYLYEGGRDTLYRIHGTNEPWTIGQSMSSGCIRMRNEDVEDLYERVRIGARVVVL
ncbi:MAG: L,D-transpeptidase [Devosiaceae bacterium]|nr:L,D-transpeptidase [Devosiaceae bacterium MH13]